MAKRFRDLNAGEKLTTSSTVVYKDIESGQYYLYTGGAVYNPVIKRLGIECAKTDAGWDVTFHNQNDIASTRGITANSTYYGGFVAIDRLYKRRLSGKRTLVYTRDGVE